MAEILALATHKRESNRKYSRTPTMLISSFRSSCTSLVSLKVKIKTRKLLTGQKWYDQHTSLFIYVCAAMPVGQIIIEQVASNKSSLILKMQM